MPANMFASLIRPLAKKRYAAWCLPKPQMPTASSNLLDRRTAPATAVAAYDGERLQTRIQPPHCRSILPTENPTLTCSVRRLNIQLLICLDWDETHRWSGESAEKQPLFQLISLREEFFAPSALLCVGLCLFFVPGGRFYGLRRHPSPKLPGAEWESACPSLPGCMRPSPAGRTSPPEPVRAASPGRASQSACACGD